MFPVLDVFITSLYGSANHTDRKGGSSKVTVNPLCVGAIFKFKWTQFVWMIIILSVFSNNCYQENITEEEKYIHTNTAW